MFETVNYRVVPLAKVLRVRSLGTKFTYKLLFSFEQARIVASPDTPKH
jgi:hypothetical protein